LEQEATNLLQGRRERMARMDYEPVGTSVRPSRPFARILLLAAIAFLIGVAATAWLLAHWSGGARMAGIAPAPAAAPAPVFTVQRQPAAPEAGPPALGSAPDAELIRRVNFLEERLATIDLQSRAAVGNAGRAEALLVAFAARRAIDRGVQLGYIETLLRDRFAGQPQAVATILTAAHAPVTLQQLQARFNDVSPHLGGGGQNQSWWQAFRTELASVITVRREGTPSTLPAERLRRAAHALDSGQVEVALLEVLRMPGRDNARDWIGDASRYVSAHHALDAIETAALLDPQPAAPATIPAVRPSAAAAAAARPAPRPPARR
jgi:hypothetical protein